jgi:predicted Zn-dependent peptidase
MEVREKRGLAYYVRSDLEHYTDTGYFSIRAGVTIAKVHEAVQVIVAEYTKIRDFGVGDEELRKAKEYTKGRFALGLEDTEAVSDFFGEEELYLGSTRTTEEILEGIEKVTAGDIARVSKEFFVNERLNLAVVGPYKDETEFKKILKL